MDEYGRKLIAEARHIILSDISDLNRITNLRIAMNKVYRYFKTIVKEPNFKDERLVELFSLEQLMKNEFLPLETEPDFNPQAIPTMPKSIVDEADCEQALRYIVHSARMFLNKNNDVKISPLTAQCLDTEFFVGQTCKELGIACVGFKCAEDLSPGIFHAFNIVTFTLPDNQRRSYIVDCTYRQFFTYADSFLERTGLMLNGGCCMGTFMLMDESRKHMAEQLLVTGYVEYTPENIKHYFDGFVFEGRNGLYYEQLGKEQLEPIDYEPHYTYLDYIYALGHGGLKGEPHIERQHKPLAKNIVFDVSEDTSLKELEETFSYHSGK